MTLEELKVVISADTKKFSREINSAKLDFHDFAKGTKDDGKVIENSVNKVDVAVTKLKRTIATLGLSKLLKDTFSKSTGIASDLAEVQNVVDVAFGNMSGDIEAFASTAIKSLGMSELSAKQYASTYMAMSNGMGIASENGKNMAIQLTKLTGDMASFYNVEQDVASTALKSVYTGETEALKKFGVVMTEANLKAFALSRGITKNYSDMTQAEKVALRYGYVMQTTANAQGDFARTSGSWANQIRILKEQWAQLLGIVGNALIKIFTPVLQLLNTILSRIVDIANAISTAFGGKQITTSLGGVSSVVDDVSTGFGTANTNAAKLKKTIMGFDELQTLSNSVTGAGGLIGGGIGGSGIILSDLTTLTDENSPLITWADKFGESLKTVKTKISKAWDEFKTDYEKNGFSLKSFVQLIIDTVKPIVDLLDEYDVLNKIKTALATGLTIFGATGSVGAGLFATIASGVVLMLTDLLPEGKFKDNVEKIIEKIKNVLPFLAGFLTWTRTGNIVTAAVVGWLTYKISKMSAEDISNLKAEDIVDKIKAILPIAAGLITYMRTGSIFGATIATLLTLNATSILTDSKKQDVSSFLNKMKDTLIAALVVGALAGALTISVGGGVSGAALAFKLGVSLTLALQAINIDSSKVSHIDPTQLGLSSFEQNWIQELVIPGSTKKAAPTVPYSSIKSEIDDKAKKSGQTILSPQEIINPKDKLKYSIVKQAKGGVWTTPTPALLAEYAGATSNPEIVAPQSIIEETINASNGQLASVFTQVGRQIIQAINDKEDSVVIGDETITRAAARGNESFKKRTGYSLI